MCPVNSLLAAFAISLVASGPLGAQRYQDSLSPRGPRFLLAGSPTAISVDVNKIPMLKRSISLTLDGGTYHEAITAIARQAGFPIVFSDDDLPSRYKEHLKAEGITVAAVLTAVLLDAGVDVMLSRDNQVVIVKRPPPLLVGTISGRVTDQSRGTAVPGVQVIVVDAGLARMTDDSGRYVIPGVPAGPHEVTARHIGYEAQTKTVVVADGATTTLDFTMSASATMLTAVVSTATGLQRKLEIGNTIAVLAADSLVAVSPVKRFDELLIGRIPSLQVMQNSGVTGSSPRVRIRGFNSNVISNDPLVLIDGVRVEATAGTTIDFKGWAAGRMSDLSVEDIESLEVVKGPSAATLYGTDAANGVIVITTKKGRAGRPSLRVYSERGVITQPSPFYTSYYAFGKSTSTGAPVRCLNYQRAAGACTLDSVTKWNAIRDSKASPVGTGERAVTGVQASGGVERFRYYLSGEHEREVGYLKLSQSEIDRFSRMFGTRPTWEQIHPNYLRRTSFRANVGTQLSQAADVSISTGLTVQRSQIPSSTLFGRAGIGPGYNDAMEGWAFQQRPAELFSTTNPENLTRATSSVHGNWIPLSWLTTRGTLGVDFSNNFYDYLEPRGQLLPTATGTRLNLVTRTRLYSGDLGSSASFVLRPGVTSKTSLGLQYNRRSLLSTAARGTGLPPGSSTVAGAASTSGNESTVESVVAGVYGEEVLGFKDRLFVTLAVRADGGSSFGRDFRVAVYPKVGISWLVSQEPWFREIAGLTSVRSRFAYGSSGVQPPSTAALPQAKPVTVYINGTTTNGARLSSIGNAHLQPERQREFETGADLEFLDGRIRTEVTYYNRLSTNALVNRYFPSSLGGPINIAAAAGGLLPRLENIGSVSNRGWEGLLNARLVDHPQFAFDLTVSGSINHNRLEYLDPSAIQPTIQFIPGQGINYRQGYPLFGEWDLPITGFKDLNGDGVISPDEVSVGDSVTYLGNPNPTQLLSVTPQLVLLRGRLTLSSLFDYKGGWIQVNFARIQSCNQNGSVCRAMNDPKAPLSDQAAHIAFVKARSQSGYYSDGTFTRWREASITYDLGARLASHVRAQSASVTLSARNLHVWTKYSGLDPEVTGNIDLFNNQWDLGYDSHTSPPVRYWIVKMNLTF